MNTREIKEYNRNYYTEHKEQILLRSAEWYRQNKDKRAEYIKRSKKQIAKQTNEYRRKNPGKVSRWKRADYLRNRDAYLIRARRSEKLCSDNLTDGFIRRLICKHSGLVAADIPQELIEAKREHLRLLRIKKEVFK